MDVRIVFGKKLIVTIAVCLLAVPLLRAADQPALTNEQIKQFLLNAKIVSSRPAHKGITNTLRLTLSDGTLTHDASFQSLDEHAASKQLASGRTALNFVDSYKYNIAAYTLAEMLGMDDLIPVYVERKYQGNAGSLSWWLPVKMDEDERLKQKVAVPDPDAWNNQMHRVRVFDQLVYDEDANLTNVLIGDDWKIWRIDFSRAFRIRKDLMRADDLVRCDRKLLEKLKTLDGDQLAQKTKHYLTKEEIKALMVRRDKIVARFQQLISEKGEDAVLY